MTWRWLPFSVLSALAVLLLGVVLTPSLREAVRERFSTLSEREILATAEGDVLNDGSLGKVIKLRTREGLFVEVYRMGPSGEANLVDRIALPDKHDGLFNYNGYVTRLAIADVNQDGKMELLAPTFDNQLVPHLNVFSYNPARGHFELNQPSGTGK